MGRGVASIFGSTTKSSPAMLLLSDCVGVMMMLIGGVSCPFVAHFSSTSCLYCMHSESNVSACSILPFILVGLSASGTGDVGLSGLFERAAVMTANIPPSKMQKWRVGQAVGAQI